MESVLPTSRTKGEFSIFRHIVLWLTPRIHRIFKETLYSGYLESFTYPTVYAHKDYLIAVLLMTHVGAHKYSDPC